MGFMFILMSFPMQGSAQSIQPFYEAKDVIFKPELIGKWDPGGVTLELRDVGNMTYGIDLLGEDGSVMRFRAHLLRLGGRYFLDGQIYEFELPMNPRNDSKGTDSKQETLKLQQSDGALNRLHGLVLIEFTANPDEFIGHLWNESWLPLMAQKKRLQSPFTKDEAGRIVLTGSSSQLHRFVGTLPVAAFDHGNAVTRVRAEGH